jgi:hypothetical protein
MDLDETMVDNIDDTGADDTLEEDDGIVEEEDSSEESLESLMGEEPEAEQEQPAEEQTKAEPPAKEPGYVKQRIEKAVQKAVAETEARMQAMFDQQMAPIRERMLNDEAKELVKSGKFGDLALAKEYLQLKQGITPQQAPQQNQPQPRNEQGRFAPKGDPAQQAEIRMLAKQANKIRETRGIDVMEEFNANPEIQAKIKSGEMDFYDVAEMMSKQQPKRPPAPTRSPNGATGHSPNAIETMSSEQFRRMEKNISEGARYSLK